MSDETEDCPVMGAHHWSVPDANSVRECLFCYQTKVDSSVVACDTCEGAGSFPGDVHCLSCDGEGVVPAGDA